MNIIFAKHDGCNKEFIFEVPDSMSPNKNDILWVETYQGMTIAKATSDVITGSETTIKQVAQKFGAYFPLKQVLAFANKAIIEYVRNEVYNEYAEAITAARLQKVHYGDCYHANEDLPF